MSFKAIILIIVLVNLSMIDSCKSKQKSFVKPKLRTSSQVFLKLRSDQRSRCQFINRDFHKLEGKWYYILRTVTSQLAPKIRCGFLNVHAITGEGFLSELQYLTEDGVTIRTAITGLFINETIVGVPELNDVIIEYPTLRQPYFVQIGICDSDTIFFMESIYYRGGGLVFTRDIPKSIVTLKLRFGTYDEQRGTEKMVQVSFNCTV